MLSDLPVLSATLAAGTVWALSRHIQERQKRRQLPPGPPGLPFIGSVLSFPKEQKWLTFTKWARKYGDVVYLNLLGTDLIIVNSRDVLSTLYESPSRAPTYSDRPALYFACEMVGWKDLTAMLNPGPVLTNHRRLMANTIGTKALLADMQDMVDMQALRFVNRLVTDGGPGKLVEHLGFLTASIILAVTYGYDVNTQQDRFLTLARNVTRELSNCLVPGAYLVDTLPFLKYLPSWMLGSGFKHEAARMRAERQQLMDEPHDWVLRELAKGTATASFLQRHLDGQVLTPEETQTIKWVSTMLYLGGEDTTKSALMTFFLCLLLNPEAQKRAQAELDLVLGTEDGSGLERLVTSSDRLRLPYVDACWRESMRWHPVAPQGLVHEVGADDVLDHKGRQYAIPKGTYVMTNIWAFTRDPATYVDPDSFRPERYLGMDAWVGKEPELDPRGYVFGVGRRACPGQLLAENTIWTVAANALALLDVRRSKDEQGRELEVVVDYFGETTTFPKAFPIEFHLRSERAGELLQTALAESS